MFIKVIRIKMKSNLPTSFLPENAILIFLTYLHKRYKGNDFKVLCGFHKKFPYRYV